MTDATIMDQVNQTIVKRKAALQKGKGDKKSRTVKLLQKGREKIAQKLGEEAVEIVIEATKNDKKMTIEESVDLLFFLNVLWADMDIDPAQVWEEMATRHGMSEPEERARRK